MADVIMVYDLMHEMRAAFEAASQQFEQNQSGLKMIQGLVGDGALVGKGAEQFLDLLENGIIPFTKQLQDKMDELAQDVEGARAFVEDGDSTAASRFK
jgi:hypothetical protein